MSHQLIEQEHCSRCGHGIVDIPWERPCPACGQYVFATQSGVRVDGKRLVVRSGAIMPQRCVFTNREDNLKLQGVRLEAQRRPGLWGLAMLPVLLLPAGHVLVHALIPKHKGELTYYVCTASENRRRIRIAIALIGFVGGVIGFVAACIYAYFVLIGLCVLIWLVSLCVLVSYSRSFGACSYKNGEFWISGCSRAFIDALREETMSPDAPR